MPKKKESFSPRKKSTRKHWTPQQDEAITQLLSDPHDTQWTQIAKRLHSEHGILGRSGKQCRQRWHNHLDPSIRKGPWSTQELISLFEAHQNYGNKWALISTLIDERSQNSIKNQFYSSIRKQYRKWKGEDATRRKLHKHEIFLSGQLLAGLQKKIRRAKKEESVEILTLDRVDPVQPNERQSQDQYWEDFFQILLM